MSAYYEQFTRWLLVGTRRFSASAVTPKDVSPDTATPMSARAMREARTDRRPRGRPALAATPAPSPPPAPSPSPIPAAKAAPETKSRFSLKGKSMNQHPGEILAQYLHDLGLTASDLARDIDVPVNRITGILNKQRGVTADTALRLGHWFEVSAADWLELQLQYELNQAEKAAGAAIRKLPRLADREAE